MTWSELYDEVDKTTSRSEYTDNIIGDLMDLYESWEWEDEIPEGAEKILG